MELFGGLNRLVVGVIEMRNETTERETRRLLARLERLEREDAAEEARDEAQRVLLARHLARLRGKEGADPAASRAATS